VFSVLPIVVIVVLLNFTVTPLGSTQLLKFLLGAVSIIVGLALFLLGVDVGIDPLSRQIGVSIMKSNKLWFVILAGLVIGFFVSVAEPDLHVLAGQVDMVTSGLVTKLSIVVIVSIGIAGLLSFGFVRIIYGIPLNKVLTGLYGIIFILALFTSPEFMAISFDASGATTGALTVPFILALALGVTAMKKDSKAGEKDSFGLVSIVSAGAIISVMLMSIVSKTDKVSGSLEVNLSGSDGILAPFLSKLPIMAFEIFLALVPLFVFFLIIQISSQKLPKHQRTRILIGLLYSFAGLVLLLTGVNAGFMEIGSVIGYMVAALDNNALLIGIGFILGLVTILAEPAVYVLTNQIEDVTSGYIRRKTVLMALSLGVGVAVALSMLRICVPGLKLWHYLLPGYVIALALTYIVPKLFVGIAFDSGGVASGPMTATFILAFAHGAAEAIEGADVLLDGFGIIAMVALTPLITLQILGLIYKLKSRKAGV
jgi:hypothetical protein